MTVMMFPWNIEAIENIHITVISIGVDEEFVYKHYRYAQLLVHAGY
jgi:hypothetical protein